MASPRDLAMMAAVVLSLTSYYICALAIPSTDGLPDLIGGEVLAAQSPAADNTGVQGDAVSANASPPGTQTANRVRRDTEKRWDDLPERGRDRRGDSDWDELDRGRDRRGENPWADLERGRDRRGDVDDKRARKVKTPRDHYGKRSYGDDSDDEMTKE